MDNLEPGFKVAIWGFGLLVVFIIGLMLLPFTIIGAGERGVTLKLGQVQTNVLNEGMHFRTPFVDDIKKINVKTRTTKIEGVAGSSDSQVVTFTAQVNWRMNANNVAKTYQSLGDERAVEENYIVTKGPDAIKEAVSKTTAVLFQQNREKVRNLAIANLKKRMGNTASVEDISFTNIDFSKEFNEAIEAKVTAEQEAQAQKNRLESIEYQAQQKVTTAQAEATAIKIKNEALALNPALIEYEKALALKINAEKFPIVPHTVLGGAVPLVNLP